MVRIGVYGRLSRTGMLYDPDVAQEFAQGKLDWIWAQPPWPYGPTYANVAKTAGKRIIVDCVFWDEPPGYVSRDWTNLYNNPELYDAAVNTMVTQIDLFDIENIYAVTISEEEPALGYNFVQPTPEQMEHFIHGHNVLYDKLKAIYPSLKIIGNPHILDWFTDAQVAALKMDGMITTTYVSDINALYEYQVRGHTLARAHGISDSDIFAISYAATNPAAWFEPNADPAMIRPFFETCLAAGVQNVGFYCSNALISGQEEMIIFNEYAPDGVDPKEDPYLHKQAMLELIDEYAEAPGNQYWIPTAVLFAIIVLILAIRRIAK